MANDRNPVKITDLTFRDGHQSLLATRVRTEDLEAIAPEMDAVGFWSMEVWGGATFDVMTRFLNEDPWDRIRTLKKLMPRTALQMLLRGQNLVGYRHYADDVVTAFVHHAADCGIDVFRVFDAVNDERNFETAFKSIRDCGKHIQGALCYSLTEPRLGGPVYNIDYYVSKALTIQDMGADSLCIKDMAGLIAPGDAYDLVGALKRALRIPVDLHSHATSGMACMSLLKAVEAGVDIVDTCLAPFALRTSHSAVEPLVVALQGTPRHTGLDLRQLLKLDEYFESIAPRYRDFLARTSMAAIDAGVLWHQIPGGMFSNMVAQLREAGALDRLDEVYAELPRTRKELGYPPLVTPTSQIVGTQAINNVLFGRYKVVSEQVKDYVYGLYGRPPAPVDAAVQQMILRGYERGQEPITCRPADTLEPEMDSAREATREIARDIGDVLIYALYPSTGMRFLRWKYGLEEPPPETRGKTVEDIEREDRLMARIRAGELVEEEVKVEVEADVALSAAAGPAVREKEEPAREIPVPAPMAGTVIRYLVAEGDEVREGDGVVVLEAMKMENVLPAPEGGRVVSISFKPGDKVKANSVLATIVQADG